MVIRKACLGEIYRLQEIEVAAGEPFRRLGMIGVADDDPPSVEMLADAINRDMCWVYETRDGRVVAYLAAVGMRESLHIEQVSVHPDFARRRYGARLIEQAEMDAGARGYPMLTLTTFTEVPWNAPYYSSLGFAEHLNSELAEVLLGEEAPAEEDWPRIGMARAVSAAYRVLAATGSV